MNVKKVEVFVDKELEPLMDKFLKNRRLDLVQLKQATADNDFKTIQMVGHRMKGTSGSFGFDMLSLFGEKLEQAAKTQDIATIRTVITDFEIFMENVLITFREAS